MRKRVNFQGYVQGVGFRYTAIMISRHFKVTGYVKNMPDGSVELVAEGDEFEIDSFIDEIKSRKTMNISSVSIQDEPDLGEFTEFTVAY
jgi:acylphosphatase